MTGRTHTLAAAAAAAAATALLAPSAALALTGHADHECYTHIPTKGSQPIVVALSGGTPGGGFVLAATVPGQGLGSAGSTDGDFDASGNASARIGNVFPPSGSIDPIRGRRVNLSVQDFGAPGSPTTQLGSVLITNLAIKVAARPISPRKPRRVTVSGTRFAHRRVYGFVVKGSSTHVLHRFRLGKGDVCGYVSHKARVAPAHYRTGRYRLYVNAGRKLERPKALRYDFRIYRRYF